MKINLGNSVIVTDPSYDTNTWCQAKIENVKEGEYNTHCEIVDTGSWGNRCSLLIASHSSYNVNNLNWEVHPNEIGVDSGQAGIFDMDNYRKDGLDIEVPKVGFDGQPFDRLEEMLKPENEGDDFYLKMCKITLSEKQWGGFDNGVICRSGYGDGGYVLYVAKDESTGKIIGFCIDFMVQEEEELSEKMPFLIQD
jgi:hypothetical protein